MRDIEVYISNEDSLPAHTLLASVEAATTQCQWNLFRENKFPDGTRAKDEASIILLSGKKVISYLDNAEAPSFEYISYDFTQYLKIAADSQRPSSY